MCRCFSQHLRPMLVSQRRGVFKCDSPSFLEFVRSKTLMMQNSKESLEGWFDHTHDICRDEMRMKCISAPKLERASSQ